MKRTASILIVMCVLGLLSKSSHAYVIPYVNLQDAAANSAARQFLNTYFARYQSQKKLARGFANASVFSSHAATHRGLQGYDLFAITVGTMAGAQAPSRDLGYYKDIHKKIQQQGDLYVGVAWNAWAAQVGLTLPIIGKRFSISGKFGRLKYGYKPYNVNFDGMHLGAMFNYHLIKPISTPIVKILMWRGLSIGTGYLYQTNNTKISVKATPIAGNVGGVDIVAKPTFDMRVKTESSVYPLEIATGFRLIFINVHAGAGVDFASGKSDVMVSSGGEISASSFGTAYPGYFMVYGKQHGKGSKNAMPKVFAGGGLALGPVVVDVPFTYYFTNGFNVGLTVGIVF
jgi:hypothetical protein